MRGCHDDADDEGADQQRDEVLVFQAYAGGGASAEPPPRPVPQQRRGHAEQHDRPGQQVVGRGVADVRRAEDHWRGGDGERGEHPAAAAGAEQRRQPGGDEDDRAARQRWQDPDRRRVHAEDVGGAGEQHGERRLVHVAERQVVACHKEVQLVLLEAVPVADDELERDERRGDKPHEPGYPVAAGRARCRGAVRAGAVNTDVGHIQQLSAG